MWHGDPPLHQLRGDVSHRADCLRPWEQARTVRRSLLHGAAALCPHVRLHCPLLPVLARAPDRHWHHRCLLFWVHGWWLFIPLALWGGWQFRKGPAMVQRDFDNMPEETEARLDRLRWLREIRRELWRAETVITPGLAEFFVELRELEDLNPRDRAAVLKADNAYRKRARNAREERVKDLFNNASGGGGMVCD